MLSVRAPLRGSAGILAALAALAPARAQRADERPCRADYAIRARVEMPERTLAGEATIRWRNESRDHVPDLWFHLYWNAFANDRSTHMRESGGELRGIAIEDEWGWQQVVSVRAGGEELIGSLRWRQPDDAWAEDRSVFSVALPRPARPGELVEVSVRWESRIPRVRRRTGYKDDFLFIAQWFPKLGVYETGNGWNCHQFHASTEFFSDYGVYDVTLDLPERYAGRIGASGVPAGSTQPGDGRVVARFTAPSEADQARLDRTGKASLVHDFAWTADPKYVVYERTFRGDDWAARYEDEVASTALAMGRGLEEVRLRDVSVTVLLQPEHADQAERHFDAACTALFFYGLWSGEYPYEHLTVVDPAWGGGAAGGMEYPTLFTAGSRMFTTPRMHTPESVTVHECGHQFWYGLVGNNEFEAAWLDEGFNTYTQSEAMARRYGPSQRSTDFAGRPFDGVPLVREPGGGAVADALALRSLDLPLGVRLQPVRASGFLDWWRAQPLLSYARMRDDPRESDRNGYLSDPDTDPIDTAGWRYCDSRSYRTNSYRRTAAALRTLAGLVGRERFLRGMREYAERWRYAHPYPQDFFDAFSQGAGVDIPWFFEEVFRGTGTVDWQVEVTQKREGEPKGWFMNAAGAFEKRARSVDADPKGDAADGEESKDGGDGGRGWKIGVVVRRKGTLLLPLKLELRYADGRKERMIWTREEQAQSTWWKPLEGREPSTRKLAAAVLDPDRDYALDLDVSDNQWHDAEDRDSPLRWAERVLEQGANLIHWYGGIGG